MKLALQSRRGLSPASRWRDAERRELEEWKGSGAPREATSKERGDMVSDKAEATTLYTTAGLQNQFASVRFQHTLSFFPSFFFFFLLCFSACLSLLSVLVLFLVLPREKLRPWLLPKVRCKHNQRVGVGRVLNNQTRTSGRRQNGVWASVLASVW